MAHLIEQTSRKSDWAIQEEERVRKARAGHASFTRSFVDMAGNVVETGPRAAAGFISSLGGASNLPEVKAEKQARKADALGALPANARKAAEPYDDGVKAFVATVYARHKATGQHLSFTATEAGKIMDKEPEAARRSVEALVSRGILAPAYNSMGGLAGYVPAILD